MLINNTFANIAVSQTDAVLVAAVAGRRIRVLAAAIRPGGTATGITFNSKGASSGTAISCLFSPGANGVGDLQFNPDGWFETNAGEALTCNTGTGSTTGLQILYALR